MPKVKETRLRKGDTIKCADAEDCGRKIRWMRRKLEKR
ncbi:hypothetical protein [Ruminococcus phage phiRM10]|uniref:Uncharacterized protein n=1 Tax=Ruminococcus phage phiRM10 TaxID=2772516 RepID=A0AAE7T2J1_9CAUD|nr:hypothetical protein [Ruminococcus phage phiRM10]